MKVDEGVLPGLVAGKNPGSSVLPRLKLVQDFAGSSGQDSIAIIQMAGDENTDGGLCHRICE